MAMIPYRDFLEADKTDHIWKPDTYERKLKKETKTYCDDIICFDTESCNFFVSPEGKVYSINDIFELCNYDVPRCRIYGSALSMTGCCMGVSFRSLTIYLRISPIKPQGQKHISGSTI